MSKVSEELNQSYVNDFMPFPTIICFNDLLIHLWSDLLSETQIICQMAKKCIQIQAR